MQEPGLVRKPQVRDVHSRSRGAQGNWNGGTVSVRVFLRPFRATGDATGAIALPLPDASAGESAFIGPKAGGVMPASSPKPRRANPSFRPFAKANPACNQHRQFWLPPPASLAERGCAPLDHVRHHAGESNNLFDGVKREILRDRQFGDAMHRGPRHQRHR